MEKSQNEQQDKVESIYSADLLISIVLKQIIQICLLNLQKYFVSEFNSRSETTRFLLLLTCIGDSHTLHNTQDNLDSNPNNGSLNPKFRNTDSRSRENFTTRAEAQSDRL